jgi:hypothetical protein|tara:strand:- start:289 stop:693 length:405 start_codon:yes stop_codon:yes gene_type:complete
MSMLTDVGTYLAAASISTQDLTLGTNLFLGRLPDSPDTCVALVQTAGVAPEDTFGTSYPPLETQGLQVLSRAAAYATAESLAVDIFKSLQTVDNQTLTSTLYLKIEATQSPFALSRDTQERGIVACNYLIMKAV